MRHTPRAGADPAGWAWIACGIEIELSRQGQVATKLTDQGWTLATGGSPMTQGRHYWEVQLRTSAACFTSIGASPPAGTVNSQAHTPPQESYCIFGAGGSLSGNGKANSDAQGRFSQGDRIGVLLDLDAGWMCFYRNGTRCGPGFTEGVTGPLVPSVQLLNEGDAVHIQPGASSPLGSGRPSEPWVHPEGGPGRGAAAAPGSPLAQAGRRAAGLVTKLRHEYSQGMHGAMCNS